MAVDTFYVESFKNILNMFHDIRISSKLAVIHQNENVYHPHTSMWVPLEAHLAANLGSRKAKSKSNYMYTKRTYGYTWSVWNNLMNFPIPTD